MGDEIMAGARARAVYRATGKRVKIRDRFGNVRVHQMWQGLEYIARPDDNGKFEEFVDGPGVRPYIVEKHADRWVFDVNYRATPGEIHLWPDEQAFGEAGAGYVILEPWLKYKASVNKDWGASRWLALAAALQARGVAFAQLGPQGTRLLPGARHIVTPTFRHACAVLARARAAVLPEGGLHHAAAALGVRAVVLFGGYIGTDTTGYESHVNLGVRAKKACGMRAPCAHCAEQMARIDPARVAALVEEMV